MSAYGTITTCPACGNVSASLLNGDDDEACKRCGWNDGELMAMPDPQQVTLTLTQDQAEHALLCARMALAQAQLAAMEASRQGLTRDILACRDDRRDTFAALCKALEAQITERV